MAPHRDHRLHVVGGADPGAFVLGALHRRRQGDRRGFQVALHPQVSEQEADEVLVALLGVDQPEVAGVGAMHHRPRRPLHVGVADPHQAVAHRSHRQRGQPLRRLVVARVGADQAEEALRREAAA